MKPSSSMSRSRDSLPASAQLRLGLEPVRPPRFLAQAVPAGWETEADVELSNGLASMNLSGSKTGLSSAESFPKVGETCPYDCLLALGIQTTPLETAAEVC